MIRPTRRGLLAAGLAFPAIARAQGGDVLRIVSPNPPGGAVDGLARMMADAAPRHGLGSAIVDTRPGAGGNIGAALAARAAPDGKTVLLALDTVFTVNPHVYRDLGFDPAALEPVAFAGTFSVALLVHPSTGITTLAGFAEAARQRPLLYVSAGNGSPGHLAMSVLGLQLGLPAGALEHVPFRGAAPATAELVAGRAQAGFITTSAAPGLIADGRVRALAVSGPEPLAGLPGVVPVAAQGHPGFDVRFAHLLMAPRGLPPASAARLLEMTRDVLADPAAQSRFAAWGIVPEVGDAATAAAWIAARRIRWAEVVQGANMRAE
jgi:tripartite-type tricarboxylate transporter receptor subunit TctC